MISIKYFYLSPANDEALVRFLSRPNTDFGPSNCRANKLFANFMGSWGSPPSPLGGSVRTVTNICSVRFQANNSIAKRRQKCQIVADDHDCQPPFGRDIGHQPHRLRLCHRIQPRRRLVGEEEDRIKQQRAQQSHALKFSPDTSLGRRLRRSDDSFSLSSSGGTRALSIL